MFRPTKPALRLALAVAIGAGPGSLAPYPAWAQDSLEDFRLQPGGSSTTGAQGPVVDGVVAPRVETPSPSPSPAPTAIPTQAPTSPASSAVPPSRTSAAPTPTPAPSATRATATPSPVPPTATATPLQVRPAPAASPGLSTAPVGEVVPLEQASPATVGDGAAASDATAWWPWLLALAAFAAGAAASGWWWKRRKDAAIPLVVVPEVQPPKVERTPVSSAAQTPPRTDPAVSVDPGLPEDDNAPLRLAFEARQLSISLTAATLDYRITITNAGDGALEGVAIAGDMIAAHASLRQDQQLASASSEMLQCHALDRLAPGESITVTGSFRLPLQRIMPIRNGTAALFVPLARLKLEAGNGFVGTIVQNAVVGQRSPRPGAGLQPFRLDLGPRIYREVTQRLFA